MSSIFITVEPPVWARLGKAVNVFFSRTVVSWNPLYWSLEVGAAADEPPSGCCQSNTEMVKYNVHVYSIVFIINLKLIQKNILTL